MAAVLLLALGNPAASQGCVGAIGPCFQGLGFLAPLAPSPFSYPVSISPDGSVVVGVSMNSSGADEAIPLDRRHDVRARIPRLHE